MAKPFKPRRLAESPLGPPPTIIQVWQCGPESSQLNGQASTRVARTTLEKLSAIAPQLENGTYHFQVVRQGRFLG